MNPSTLSNGTTVYFKVGEDTVFEGVVVGREKLKKHYAASQYTDTDNLVEVNIDRQTRHTEDSLPAHMAPEKYQDLSSDEFFRSAYTIDADTQHYILTPDNLVEVV